LSVRLLRSLDHSFWSIWCLIYIYRNAIDIFVLERLN
jgi:hypothetical protein